MTYEDFGITFEWSRKTEQGDRYQALAWHSRLPAIGGPLTPRQEDFVQASEVQEVQLEYSALIDHFHQHSVNPTDRSFDQSALIELGRRVKEILPKRTQASLIESAARARYHGQHLRIIIAVHQNASTFLRVPWELLVLPLSLEDRSEDNDDFLLLDKRFILVRQVLGVGRISPTIFDRPLRFQSFIAQPCGAPPIETAAIKEMLAQYGAPLAMYCYEGASTLENMQLRLLRHTPQILHLLCHGSESTVQIKARHDLLLTHSDGYIRRANIYDLAPVLSLDPDLRLVLLQACYGGVATLEQEQRTSESIALGLLRRGVPFVIAFQGEVAQKPAAAFIDAIFEALAKGEPIEQAVALGRIAMLQAEGNVEWSLPVLYSGQAPTERRTMLHRISDRFYVALLHPDGVPTIRSVTIAVALCLIVSGFVRWIFFPDAPAPSVPTQFPAILALWSSVGGICPAIIAMMHQDVLRNLRGEEHAAVRRAVQLSQWMNAYIGYAFGSIIGLLLLGIAYLFGVLSLVPQDVQFVPVIPAILWSLFWSYNLTRWGAGNALADHERKETFYTGKWVVLLVILSCFLIVGFPAALAQHVQFEHHLLGHPPLIALTMGLFLIAMVLLFERA